jgi:hypothetical protein
MNQKWPSYLFYVLVICFVLLSIRESISSFWLLIEGNRITGKVIRFESDTNNRKKTVKRPVFEYKVNGNTYTIKADISSDLQYDMNDTETILTSPSNADFAKISSFLELWLSSLLYVFAVIAFFAFRFALRMVFHLKI